MLNVCSRAVRRAVTRPTLLPRYALPIIAPAVTNLVTNGGFDADTGWTKAAGWTIAGGKLVGTGLAGFVEVSQALSVVAGTTYRVQMDLVINSGGIIMWFADAGTYLLIEAGGHIDQNLVANGSGRINIDSSGGGFDGTIDNLVVTPA